MKKRARKTPPKLDSPVGGASKKPQLQSSSRKTATPKTPTPKMPTSNGTGSESTTSSNINSATETMTKTNAPEKPEENHPTREETESTSPKRLRNTSLFRFGFLGLGIMGSGMVANLIKSGHDVMVWNRTKSKCRESLLQGATKGATAAAVVAHCDVTFSCVSDSAALKGGCHD
jgi:3-hydroxyisobutyrate dehydrogenase